MSKNQRGLWPARSSDFRIPSCFQTQNGCFCCCLPTPATFMVGLTGLEPVTLRLSSACSNQLSYRPGSRFAPASGVAALWWRHGDSNPRPIACKATALPTELCPHTFRFESFHAFSKIGVEAKTELCVTVSNTLSLCFFRYKGLDGMSGSEEPGLAVDLRHPS